MNSILILFLFLPVIAFGGKERLGGDPKFITEAEVKMLIEQGDLKKSVLNYADTLNVKAVRPERVKNLFEDMQRRNLRKDVELSRYYVSSNCIKTVHKKEKETVPASTELGVFGAPICFNAPMLREELKGLSKIDVMIKLVGLAFHEHAHHFSKNETEAEAEITANLIGAYVQKNIEPVPLMRWVPAETPIPSAPRAIFQEVEPIPVCVQREAAKECISSYRAASKISPDRTYSISEHSYRPSEFESIRTEYFMKTLDPERRTIAPVEHFELSHFSGNWSPNGDHYTYLNTTLSGSRFYSDFKIYQRDGTIVAQKNHEELVTAFEHLMQPEWSKNADKVLIYNALLTFLTVVDLKTKAAIEASFPRLDRNKWLGSDGGSMHSLYPGQALFGPQGTIVSTFGRKVRVYSDTSLQILKEFEVPMEISERISFNRSTSEIIWYSAKADEISAVNVETQQLRSIDLDGFAIFDLISHPTRPEVIIASSGKQDAHAFGRIKVLDLRTFSLRNWNTKEIKRVDEKRIERLMLSHDGRSLFIARPYTALTHHTHGQIRAQLTKFYAYDYVSEEKILETEPLFVLEKNYSLGIGGLLVQAPTSWRQDTIETGDPDKLVEADGEFKLRYWKQTR